MSAKNRSSVDTTEMPEEPTETMPQEPVDQPACRIVCATFGALMASIALFPALALHQGWDLGDRDPFDIGLRATVAATMAFLPLMVWLHWTRCLAGTRARRIFLARLRRVPVAAFLVPTLSGSITLFAVLVHLGDPGSPDALYAICSTVALAVTSCALCLHWIERRWHVVTWSAARGI